MVIEEIVEIEEIEEIESISMDQFFLTVHRPT
jgi:hypothetical protein